MMSTDNIPTKPAGGEDNQISSGGEPPSKCPRCDSPNTKFCYYNNYSLTQPRHFCKTCRRYWTKGGALRNVPIGGGCRKNKRTKSTTSTIFSGDSKDSPTSSHSGFNFFQENSPAMDFQIGNGGGLPFSRLQYTNINHQFVTCATNPSCFDHPIGIRGDGGFKYIDGGIREMGSMNVNSSLASSIESLSCMNQDLHWKLQQQRLAMVLGEETNKDGECVSDLPVVTAVPEIQIQKPQPITFQNLGISKQEANMKSGMSGATTTEWVFENSYTNPTSTTTTITTNNNNSGGNENDNTSSWNGIQAWTDLHHYSGLP